MLCYHNFYITLYYVHGDGGEEKEENWFLTHGEIDKYDALGTKAARTKRVAIHTKTVRELRELEVCY